MDASPKDLYERYGFLFDVSHDDLDDFYACAIETQTDFRHYVFLKYFHSPEPGIQIWCRESTIDEELKHDLATVLSILQLQEEAYSWIHPRLAHLDLNKLTKIW